MPTVILVARLALAAVLLAAGVAKIADRGALRQTVAAFGVPARLTRPVAFLLPLVEVAVAIALVVAASARIAAVAALALLILFVGAILVALGRGKQPECRCFGQLSDRPIGAKTVARNAFLAVVAAAIAFAGHDATSASATAWVGELNALVWIALLGVIALVAAVALEGWLILNLLRQQGRLLVRIDALEVGRADSTARPDRATAAVGLPVGAEAPGFALPDLDGNPVTLDVLRSRRVPVVLVFIDPGCGPCTSMLPEIARWQADFTDALVVVVVSRGDTTANRRRAADAGLGLVVVQQDDEVAEAYRLGGTPAAVLVSADGRVAGAVVTGADLIRDLVIRQVARQAARTLEHEEIMVRDRGNPVRAFSLADLDGRLVESSQFLGRDTLLLFWNPDCGFCQAMLPELRRWEETALSAAPQLVVISTGSVEANRAMGLRSPVLLDPMFSVAAAFGAAGTPVAVLLDHSGAVGSGLAQGAHAVMELAGTPRPVPAVTS